MMCPKMREMMLPIWEAVNFLLADDSSVEEILTFIEREMNLTDEDFDLAVKMARYQSFQIAFSRELWSVK